MYVHKKEKYIFLKKEKNQHLLDDFKDRKASNGICGNCKDKDSHPASKSAHLYKASIKKSKLKKINNFLLKGKYFFMLAS